MKKTIPILLALLTFTEGCSVTKLALNGDQVTLTETVWGMHVASVSSSTGASTGQCSTGRQR